VHVAIDDATRRVYVVVFADELIATTLGFLARAVGWFSEQGITCRRVLSDNGPAYRSGDSRKACRALDLKPIRTKPYTPRTNGKTEGFIKTLLTAWAYVIAYQTSEERNCWLPRYLGIDNGTRCQMALGGLSPQQCFQRLLIA
jgi:transposase InsO family protein